MAPNELSTSADNLKPTAANFIPNCAALLLSSPRFTPFPKTSPSSSSSKKLNLIPQDIAQNLHTSILSATTNFLTKLHSFASQNPLLNKLIHFQNQIRYERHKSANLISTRNFAAVLPGDSVAGIVVTNGILNFLNLYNTVLIVRLVLTWFPNAPSAIVAPLSTVCDPYLNIFRGIIPPLGGTLDLSPILAFLVLNVFTSTASALPAELPATEHRSSASQARSSGVTSSQQKWLRRIHGGGVGTKKSSSDSH